jgi:hypothetical protein
VKVWLNINRNGRLGNRLFARAHVYAAARELGATTIYDKKLIGLGAAEKLLGKEKAKVIMPTITVKGAGAPTLAPASDPRPALSDATDGFNPETE